MSDTPASNVTKAFAPIKEPGVLGNILYPDWITKTLIEWIWAFVVGPLVLLLLLDTLHVLVEPAFAPEAWDSLQDPIFMTTVLTALIGGLVFRYLVRKAPAVFVGLAARGRLVVPQDRKTEWSNFGLRLASRVRSRAHWLNVAAWMIGVGIYIGLVNSRRQLFAQIGAGFSPDPHFPAKLLFSLLLLSQFVLTPLLWGFIAARVTSIMGVLAEAIRKLTSAFDLDILPDDPDRCGGFCELGDICFNLALPVGICAVYAGFWGLGLTAIQSQSETRPFMLLGVPVLVVLAFIVFFWPMWDVHRDMVVQRDRYQADVERQMTEAEHALQAFLQQKASATTESAGRVKPRANNEKQLAQLAERLKALRELSPTARNYPTWPSDWKIFLKFFSPNLVSVIALLLGLTRDQGESLRQIGELVHSLFSQ